MPWFVCLFLCQMHISVLLSIPGFIKSNQRLTRFTLPILLIPRSPFCVFRSEWLSQFNGSITENKRMRETVVSVCCPLNRLQRLFSKALVIHHCKNSCTKDIRGCVSNQFMPGYNGLDYLMQEFFATERKTSGKNGNIIADFEEYFKARHYATFIWYYFALYTICLSSLNFSNSIVGLFRIKLSSAFCLRLTRILFAENQLQLHRAWHICFQRKHHICFENCKAWRRNVCSWKLRK